MEKIFGVDVEIKGLKELHDKLMQLGPKVGGAALRKAVREATKPIISQAKANLGRGDIKHLVGRWEGEGFPVYPGYAQSTVKAAIRVSRDKSFVRARIGVGRYAFYAVQFVELGTSRIARRQWLQPALEANLGTAVSKIGQETKKQIEKVARSRGRA